MKKIKLLLFLFCFSLSFLNSVEFDLNGDIDATWEVFDNDFEINFTKLLPGSSGNIFDVRNKIVGTFGSKFVDKSLVFNILSAYSPEFFYQLLPKIRNVNQRDFEYRTIFDYLVFSWSRWRVLPACQELLNRGLNLSYFDIGMNTPLINAVKSNAPIEIIRLILDNMHPNFINLADLSGRTFINYAIDNLDFDVLNEAMDRDLDILGLLSPNGESLIDGLVKDFTADLNHKWFSGRIIDMIRRLFARCPYLTVKKETIDKLCIVFHHTDFAALLKTQAMIYPFYENILTPDQCFEGYTDLMRLLKTHVAG